MRIRVIGSAAGKPTPRPFCDCRVCRHATRHGGKNVRTRTHAHLFLDGDVGAEPRYAIDLSPDLPSQMVRGGFRLTRLEHLLVTHAHADHLFVDGLRWRPSIRSAFDDLPVLTVYGSSAVADRILDGGTDLAELRLRFQVIEPGQRFRAGEVDVLALEANEIPAPALNYVVANGGRRALLAWDTAPWPDSTWSQIEGERVDAVFTECTAFGPDLEPGPRHMTFDQVREMRAGLIARGVMSPETPHITVHQGDNGGLTHDEMVELGARHGITPSYDGFELSV